MNRPPNDLREFLQQLAAAGELQTVTAEVDPRLEIAAITDRVCKGPEGGPALRFERPRGFAVPVLTNLFGSPRRLALALGVERLAALGPRLAAELATTDAGSGLERLAELLAQPRWRPQPVADGPCREVRPVGAGLEGIPALHSWPGDGGPYLTFPQVFTRHPQTDAENCGLYRLQLFADGSLGLHLAPSADAAAHLAAWRDRGRAMPVAVALGGPPALLLAAALPLPPGVAETALAGWLLGAPLPMVDACGGALRVPASAEWVIEGEIRPGDLRPEGPFGNHTGAYVPAAPAPVLRVTAVSHRRRPLYPATVVGPPPMEDCWLAQAAARLLLPVLQTDIPEIVDWHLPAAGIFHGAALIAARCRPGGGGEVLARLQAHPLLRRSRLLILFDGHVDVSDPAACYWRAVNLVDPGTDLRLADGRLAIDATGSDPAAEVGPAAATRQLLAERWREYGLPDR